MDPTTAFALVSVLHAGFQLTVTVLVYPALASRNDAEWSGAHARHSRSIAPVVGLVYGALLLGGAVLVVSGPGPAGWLAVAAASVAVVLTMTLAAPLHGRLTERDDVRVRRLLVVDRCRCAAAVLGALAAVVALG